MGEWHAKLEKKKKTLTLITPPLPFFHRRRAAASPCAPTFVRGDVRESEERREERRDSCPAHARPLISPYLSPSFSLFTTHFVAGKAPVQGFFTEELGMPLTMTPDFETQSCLMVFGASPPPLEADPALVGAACLGDCPTGRSGGGACLQLGGGGGDGPPPPSA